MKKIFTLFILVSYAIISNAQLHSSEFLINTTVKIHSTEIRIKDGKSTAYSSSGTGFFFRFSFGKDLVPVIVTNKHVVRNSSTGYFYMKFLDSAGNFNYGRLKKIEFEKFEDKWIMHPDTTIDLAIMPIGPLLNYYEKNGTNLIFAPFDESNIPNDSILNTFMAIEEILMIGYPFGLMDAANDLPIVRRGITATPLFINYNSKAEFLCDASVYKGSSGSPITIFNSGMYTTKQGSHIGRDRLFLLGINYATYTQDFLGKIYPIQSYEANDSSIVRTNMPYNIAIVIKSSKLLDFKPVLSNLMNNSIKRK